MASVAPTYKKRAIQLKDYKYLRIYVLSREDIVVSKIGRLDEKDIEDIKTMLPECDIALVHRLSDEVVNRFDMTEKAQQIFENNFRKIITK